MEDRLASAIADLEEETALALARERLDAGDEPLAVLEACRQGMAKVGERFQKGEYFISELVFSGEIFKEIARTVEPRLTTAGDAPRAAVVIGTVKGDLHDIGKDLVVLLLKASNYRVHDLGVDVPPQRFVEALRETGATVLALSALLTTAFDAMRETVAAVDRAGLRPGVRVMVGGGPVNRDVKGYTGADDWGSDAYAALDLCNRWTGNERHG